MFGGISKSEILALDKYWKAFPSLMDSLFVFNEHGYASLRKADDSDTDIATVIANNSDVQAFREHYANDFADYRQFLNENIVQQMTICNIQQKHEELITDLYQIGRASCRERV